MNSLCWASCHPTKWAPPHLHPQDAKDDEKGTADEHNVADGLKGGDECLHHQLQARGPANDPAGRQGRTGHCEPTERQPQLSPHSPDLLKGEVPIGNEAIVARLPRTRGEQQSLLRSIHRRALDPTPSPHRVNTTPKR